MGPSEARRSPLGLTQHLDLLSILISPVPPKGETISPKNGTYRDLRISPEGLIPPPTSVLFTRWLGLARSASSRYETFHSRVRMDVKIDKWPTSAIERFHFCFKAQKGSGFLFDSPEPASNPPGFNSRPRVSLDGGK